MRTFDYLVVLVVDIGPEKWHFVLAMGREKWHFAVAFEGKIYGVPYNEDRLLVYDPRSGEVSGIDTSSVATGPCKWRAAVVVEGKIYGVPCNADWFLVYDTCAFALVALLVALQAAENGTEHHLFWATAFWISRA